MGLKDAKERKKSKEREKKQQELIDSIERVTKLEAAAPSEVWMMGAGEAAEEIYEVTDEDKKRMSREPVEAMAGGGKVMRYFNQGGGVYGYNHGGGVNKHQGQYDIQVKKIKGKGKVL